MAKPLFTGPEAICVPYTGRTTENGTPEEGEPCGSIEGQRIGEDIYEMINEALREEREGARVRAVASCLRRFPRETLQHPEVYLYLDHLARHGRDDAIARILQDRPRRGRPSRSAENEFLEIALIEAVIKRERCSAHVAIDIVKAEHRDVFGHKDKRSIANDYSRLREAYRLAIECRWLPSSKVTDLPWSRPDRARDSR